MANTSCALLGTPASGVSANVKEKPMQGVVGAIYYVINFTEQSPNATDSFSCWTAGPYAQFILGSVVKGDTYWHLLTKVELSDDTKNLV